MKALYVLRHFHITDNQLEYFRKKGLPCKKRGPHYNYDLEEVEKWIEENAPQVIMKSKEEWIGREELCSTMGVSRHYLGNLLKKDAPFIKLHRNLFLYNMEDITEYLGLPRMDKYEVGSLLNKHDLIEELGISEQTYYYWLRCGMPCYRFSKKLLRFELEHVENWINRGMKNE